VGWCSEVDRRLDRRFIDGRDEFLDGFVLLLDSSKYVYDCVY